MTSRTDHFNQCESIVQTNMGCVKMLAMVSVPVMALLFCIEWVSLVSAMAAPPQLDDSDLLLLLPSVDGRTFNLL